MKRTHQISEIPAFIRAALYGLSALPKPKGPKFRYERRKDGTIRAHRQNVGFTGAELREMRARNGVGRPPKKKPWLAEGVG